MRQWPGGRQWQPWLASIRSWSLHLLCIIYCTLHQYTDHSLYLWSYSIKLLNFAKIVQTFKVNTAAQTGLREAWHFSPSCIIQLFETLCHNHEQFCMTGSCSRNLLRCCSCPLAPRWQHRLAVSSRGPMQRSQQREGRSCRLGKSSKQISRQQIVVTWSQYNKTFL